jgi:transposase
MTKAVEVITSFSVADAGRERRRSGLLRLRLSPGASACEVARAAGVHVSQLFQWRQQLCERMQIPAAFNRSRSRLSQHRHPQQSQ